MSGLTRREFLAAPLAFLFALTAAPAAHATNFAGWVIANQPDATEPYTPSAQYNFSSNGSPNEIVPNGRGAYTVSLPFYITGNHPTDVQVSAYNTSGWCVLMGWQVNGGISAKVQCYDQTGTPANAAFAVLYQLRDAPFGSASKGVAFLMGDQLTQANSYTPSAQFSFNSTGGTNMAKDNPGHGATSGVSTNYTFTLPGLTKIGGNVQVTPVYFRARCKTVSWGVVSGGTTVTVQCFSPYGGPLHSEVALAYSVGEPFGVLPGKGTYGGAWAYANDPTSTAVYTPILTHQFNGFASGPLTAQKTGTGLYTVTIPGTLSYTSSVALVQATGDGNSYCNLVSWSGSTINVACYGQGGVPTDSRFEVSFQTATQP